MVESKAHAEKILVLGVDGLDPRFSRKMVDEGKMPNLAKIIEKGACRQDLVLLGGHPTITPPMWTTLATGCNSYVHGITGFYRQHPSDLSAVSYCLDSRLCKAEQIWNITAESGKKTLVFHWPGSSWPPTSDSENLFVIDGTSPGALGMATSQTEKEFLLIAHDKVTEPRFVNNADPHIVAQCVVEELPDSVRADNDAWDLDSAGFIDKMSNCFDFDLSKGGRQVLDLVQSYVKAPANWANEVPADAKETVILLSSGLIRRPALLLKNEDGKYDKLAVYKSKKDAEPMVVLEVDKVQGNIIDEGYNKKDEKKEVVRNMKLISVAEDGNSFELWVSAAMDCNIYETWHPQRMYDYVKEVAGPTPPTANIFELTEKHHACMMSGWEVVMDWQSKAMHEIIEREGIEVVFSHMHNIDLINHTFIYCMAPQVAMGNKMIGWTQLEHETFLQWEEDLYKMTDDYFGTFMHYLDEGWTILVTSDHAQVSPTHGFYYYFGSIVGYTITVMEEWGLTTMMRDAEGNKIREVDWSKTKAIANRSNDIWINLKGRNTHVQSDGTVVEGIVDPADKYELEEEIMTLMYQHKHPRTGKRVFALALRNKDAVHFGMGGPETGDIVYFLAEGYNGDHGDSLSTAWGEGDTSVSPIFVGAGPGFKQGYYTDRVIRQIDFAPTISALLGLRMPAQAEGAPAYQILDWEF